jgi:hypothetical protein
VFDSTDSLDSFKILEKEWWNAWRHVVMTEWEEIKNGRPERHISCEGDRERETLNVWFSEPSFSKFAFKSILQSHEGWRGKDTGFSGFCSILDESPKPMKSRLQCRGRTQASRGVGDS